MHKTALDGCMRHQELWPERSCQRTCSEWGSAGFLVQVLRPTTNLNSTDTWELANILNIVPELGARGADDRKERENHHPIILAQRRAPSLQYWAAMCPQLLHHLLPAQPWWVPAAWTGLGGNIYSTETANTTYQGSFFSESW